VQAAPVGHATHDAPAVPHSIALWSAGSTHLPPAAQHPVVHLVASHAEAPPVPDVLDEPVATVALSACELEAAWDDAGVPDPPLPPPPTLRCVGAQAARASAAGRTGRSKIFMRADDAGGAARPQGASGSRS
jgi:hypothetical protein